MVRNDRRVELAFEGQRARDIRRWGIFKEVMSTAVEGVEYREFVDKDGNPHPSPIHKVLTVVSAEARAVVGEKYHIWPIPQTEIDADKNGLITQNSNWL